tara:strand:- start:135 stop:599 length:465 start_codon:yes stop_codon:yes gene_type:complete
MKNFPLVWVVNGPNLNKLGSREVQIYGEKSLTEINSDLSKIAETHSIEIDFFQSNHEGDLVDLFHRSSTSNVAGFIFNPGAFSHTSIAIRDAITSIENPLFVEVHLSNIYSREKFRHFSYFSDIANGVICGFGYHGYFYGLNYLIELINGSKKT